MNRFLATLRPRWAGADDHALLDRFRAGRDEAAFAELVRRHGPVVWGACRRGLANAADAEDAFQATFLVLVRRAAAVARHPALGPWLYRVALLTVQNARRANRRRVARAATPPAAADETAAVDAHADLDAAVSALPDRLRGPVVLCHLQGLTRAEAAARLGRPEGTVSAQLAEALKRLRRRLWASDPAARLAVAGAVAVSALLPATAARAATLYAAAAPGVSPAVSSLSDGVIRMVRVRAFVTATLVAGMVVALLVGVRAAAVSADPPPAAVLSTGPPAALAGKWRLTYWTSPDYGSRQAVFTLTVVGDGLAALPPAGKPQEWGRRVSEPRWADGKLTMTFDFTEPNGPKSSYQFVAAYDPASPTFVRGSLVHHGTDGKPTGTVYPAELDPSPWDAPPNHPAGMVLVRPRAMAMIVARLLDARIAKRNGTFEDNGMMVGTAYGDGGVLRLVAEHRKPDRRGLDMLWLLVRFADFAQATPDEVDAWAQEMLRFAAPYGPAYCDSLRTLLADDLDYIGASEYRPVAATLRAGRSTK